MKISGNKPPEGTDVVRLPKSGKKGQAQPAGKPPFDDKVELSFGARELGDIVGGVKELPDVRAEKVAGIRDRIESGKYAVDPVKVAKKMIDEIV